MHKIDGSTTKQTFEPEGRGMKDLGMVGQAEVDVLKVLESTMFTPESAEKAIYEITRRIGETIEVFGKTTGISQRDRLYHEEATKKLAKAFFDILAEGDFKTAHALNIFSNLMSVIAVAALHAKQLELFVASTQGTLMGVELTKAVKNLQHIVESAGLTEGGISSGKQKPN